MDNLCPGPEVDGGQGFFSWIRPRLIRRGEERPHTMIDENKLRRFSGRYLSALRTSLEGAVDFQAARRLGLQAGRLGLTLPDLAQIHNLAVPRLALPPVSEEREVDRACRATDFFARASLSLRAPAGQDPVVRPDLAQLDAALILRTQEARESRAKLREGVTRRKAAESVLQASRQKSTRLLEESRPLQKHLQDMVRRLLAAQESERKTLSLTLQDEIAQTLLGIEIRLLALGKEAATSNDDFKKEIAATQKLVEKSVRTINRFARLFGSPDEN